MDSYLYLIEILIQEVCQSGQNIDKSEINVDVKLGTLNDINIQMGEKPDVFDVTLLNPGKSYLFPASSYVLKHQMSDTKIKFVVKCNEDPNKIIGETTMEWPRSFRKLVERSNEKNLLPESITETLCFTNNCGHIKVFMRFSCLGNDIQTQYQVMQTKDEAMSYLFKGSKIPAPFQSPEYGKGGANDLLPVGPIYSTRDRGRTPSNYSLDITVSEIEANLCNDKDCLAAYKFKKYGIGPLAKEKREIKSPCGSPSCKYAYEVGESPCVGHRKCKYNLPRPDVSGKHVCGGFDCLGNPPTVTSELSQIPRKSTRPCGKPNCPETLVVHPLRDTQRIPCPSIKKDEPKRYSCEQPCFPPKKFCCDNNLRAGGLENNCSLGDTVATSTSTIGCGKPNCKNIEKLKNPYPITICEDCGGYSRSGKTCKDIKKGPLLDSATQMDCDNEVIRIENVKCFCEPKCIKSRLNSETLCNNGNRKYNTKMTSTKSEIIGSTKKSIINTVTYRRSISQTTSYGKGKRLRSGATSLHNTESPIQLSSPPQDDQKAKKKGRKTNLVYSIGDTYPDNHYGHKKCKAVVSIVSWQKGWKWFPEPTVCGLKPRKAYRPGYITPEIQNIIDEAREKAGLPEASKPIKKKKKRSSSRTGISERDDDDENEYEVEDKKTLYFSKKEGTYFIDLNPLRDPKQVKENEDPYINCPPIKFKYTEDPLKKAMKEYDACDCCTCDLDKSEDEDLNLEFSPPRGVVEMDKMVKQPNVSHFWTQYDPTDFGAPRPRSKRSTKSSKKN